MARRGWGGGRMGRKRRERYEKKGEVWGVGGGEVGVIWGGRGGMKSGEKERYGD